MRRIVVLGCSGSGKSTLARRLGERTGLPVVHLDVLYWQPGWQQPDPASFLARVETAIAGDAWITDGNYRETFPLRLPRADLVVILHPPRWLRFVHVIARIMFANRRADLPQGCPERWNWDLARFIWRFDAVSWPRIDAARLQHGSAVPVIRLRSRRDVAAFLKAIPPAGLPLPPGAATDDAPNP